MRKIDSLDDMDQFDRRILEVLSEDGRIPVTELSKRVGLSKTPCQARLKRLVDEGYILGFRAAIDPENWASTISLSQRSNYRIRGRQHLKRSMWRCARYAR